MANKLYHRLHVVKNLVLKPDFSSCKPFSSEKSKFDSCKDVITSAYVDVNIKCKVYLDLFQYCTKNRKGCENFENNVKFCAKSVLTERLSTWEKK